MARRVATNRRRRRRRSRRNPAAPFQTSGVYSANRRRRRRTSRRRYRRNPGYRRNQPAIQPALWDLAYATGGFLGTKWLGNMVMPMLGVPDQPVMRIGAKIGIAYLGAWGLSNFLGRRYFTPLLLGGSIEAIQDFVKEFVAPQFPQLAAAYEPMGIYYGGNQAALPAPGMGSYYGQMGDAWYAGQDMQTAF